MEQMPQDLLIELRDQLPFGPEKDFVGRMIKKLDDTQFTYQPQGGKIKLVIRGLRNENGKCDLVGQMFEFAVRKYGILDEPYTVRLTWLPVEFMRSDGYGITCNIVYPGNVITMELADVISKHGGDMAVAEVFFHEMWHVKQIIQDGLRGDLEKDGIWFKDKFYPSDGEALKIAYDNSLAPKDKLDKYVPWEKEAYETRPVPYEFFRAIGKDHKWFKQFRTLTDEQALKFARRELKDAA